MTSARVKYDQLLRTYRLPKRHAPFSQSIFDSGRLHLAGIPSGIDHPIMEHGQIRPTSIAHGISSRSLPLLRLDFNPAVHWYHKLRLRRNRLRVHLPAVPWLRIPPSALVRPSTDLS